MRRFKLLKGTHTVYGRKFKAGDVLALPDGTQIKDICGDRVEELPADTPEKGLVKAPETPERVRVQVPPAVAPQGSEKGPENEEPDPFADDAPPAPVYEAKVLGKGWWAVVNAATGEKFTRRKMREAEALKLAGELNGGTAENA